MVMVKALLLTILAFQAYLATASDFPRVDADLKIYDDTVLAKNVAFSKVPVNPHDKNWVKLKLSHMVDVDQYMRGYSDTPFKHSYSKEETDYFQTLFGSRWSEMDSQNTNDVKKLLEIYSWFTVTSFGGEADRDAWLLVQHADHDPEFQKQVLTILDKLYITGETNPSNYAYLWDRVAASWSDTSQRKPQRYGTQGTCTGPGTWEPLPVEDPSNLDTRRRSVGLGPEAEYIALFKDLCH